MARRNESHFIAGPAGRLESLLEEPEDRDPIEACLVCHPHPLFGGNMHNKVVYRLARGLRRSGCVVLRFNFRGVNLSEGTHDHGPGELDDARTALAFLRERYPELPYSLAGFSFGARIALRLGCDINNAQAETGPRRAIGVGFPTTIGHFDYLDRCTLPKYFVHSTQDVYGPRLELEKAFASFAEPKRLEFIEAGDHFFAGSLDALENAIIALPPVP
jgi:alpha/beta superfamily hydrolase